MATKSPYTDRQYLQELHIDKLRGLENITLSFCDSAGENMPGVNKRYVTGIFGMNGSGKTTLLQTIICLYRPKKHRNKVFKGAAQNTKMSRFFKYVDGNYWGDSSFTAKYEHDLLKGANRSFATKKLAFSKSTIGKKEWKPRQTQKFDRDIFYIPVQTSVPDIEFIAKEKTNVSYSFTFGANLSDDILQAARHITEINYQHVEQGKTAKCESYRVTKLVNGAPITYHSFNMGAGEQRLFRILNVLYNAPDYSLIAIDELDMTLHSAALKRFISIINQKAIEKKLQVFFTSHRPELMDIPEIHAFYIMHRNNTTICLDNPTSNCYEELTGNIEKPLVIFLEDKFSKEISRKTLMDLNLLQRANITSVGTYHNCIVMLYATICQIHDQEMTAPDPINADNRTENKIKDCIAILDGDVTLDELNTKINHIITGTDPITVKRKSWVRSQILQYNSRPSIVQNNKNMCPEEYIHDTFARIPNPSSSIIIESNRVILPDNDPHKYFTNLLDTNTFTIESIINEFATTGAWGNYINPIKVWAEVQKRTHGF